MEIREIASLSLLLAFVALAGLVTQAENHLQTAIAVNIAVDTDADACLDAGFDTPQGHVGCVETVSATLPE
jgi:hypothetical protein